jgi:hypothetical protein
VSEGTCRPPKRLGTDDWRRRSCGCRDQIRSSSPTFSSEASIGSVGSPGVIQPSNSIRRIQNRLQPLPRPVCRAVGWNSSNGGMPHVGQANDQHSRSTGTAAVFWALREVPSVVRREARPQGEVRRFRCASDVSLQTLRTRRNVRFATSSGCDLNRLINSPGCGGTLLSPPGA